MPRVHKTTVVTRTVIFSDSCYPAAISGPEPDGERVVHHGAGDGGAEPAGPPAQRRPAVGRRPGEVRRAPPPSRPDYFRRP